MHTTSNPAGPKDDPQATRSNNGKQVDGPDQDIVNGQIKTLQSTNRKAIPIIKEKVLKRATETMK